MDDTEVVAYFREQRILVYRYILSQIEAGVKSPLLATQAIIWGHGFVCSPAVSVAIYEYYNMQGELLEKFNADLQDIYKNNSLFEALIKGVVSQLKNSHCLHVELSNKTKAIANAMCEDLAIDMETLKGISPASSEDTDGK